MFHPMVAGVTIPGMGIFVLMLAPYIDRTRATSPRTASSRSSLFTIFLMFWAVLVIIGSFFRGPGFNFMFPWRDGHLLRPVMEATPMSAATVLAIAIAVVVVLAAIVVFVTTARRRDPSDADRSLSRETRATATRRAADAARAAAGRSTGREVERAAAEARSRRRRPSVARREPRRRRPPSPPDPETLGVTRRQFFNRGIVTFMSLGLGGFGAVDARLPVAAARRRLRLEDHASASSTTSRRDRPGQRLLLRRPRAARGSPRTRRTPSPRPRPSVYSGAVLAGMRRASSRSTRSARTSVAACRSASRSQWFECPCHGSQYNRVGEKKGGPAPRGMDRFAVDGRRRHRHGRHEPRASRARPSAPTPPARKPKVRTASPGVSDADLRSPTTVGRHIAIVIVDRRSSLVGSSTSSATCAGPRPRSVPRSSWRRTASRTSTTRSSRARSSTGCSSSGWVSSWSRRRRSRSTGCTSRAVRRAPSRASTSASPDRGAELLRAHGPGRLQLRRMPRARRPSAVSRRTRSRPGHRPARGGELEGARAATPCCSSSARTRCATSSPTAARSHRCRRGASPAVAR